MKIHVNQPCWRARPVAYLLPLMLEYYWYPDGVLPPKFPGFLLLHCVPALRTENCSGDAADLDALRQLGTVNKQRWMMSENTVKSYDGYIKRVKAFLSELVEKKRADLADSTRDETWATRTQDNADKELDLDLLEKALDNPPNCYSGMVVESACKKY